MAVERVVRKIRRQIDIQRVVVAQQRHRVLRPTVVPHHQHLQQVDA